MILPRAFRATVALMATLLAGCAPFNYTGPDSPRALTAIAPLNPPPRIALVLSSGGPRGYAHIGVMRVLDEAGIEVDLVAAAGLTAITQQRLRC